ncbi:hypothetical protein, partial [Blautia sp. AF34-10]|uniref:hypothetical protein n=1 Tax=Blautia sp. AF34-10 TaxID=2292968 RepID=UPI001A9B5AED
TMEVLGMAIYQFEYHTFLHHSQTDRQLSIWWKVFEYHTFLHHSQTSNLKMNCFHLHKTGTQTSDGY